MSWRSRRGNQHSAVQSPSFVGPRRKKTDRGQRSAFPSETSRFRAFDSRAQGFSTPLARRQSSCSPPLLNRVATHPIVRYQAFRDRAPCLSRVTTLPKGTRLELGREANLVNSILNQPYRRRVSTDQLNRKDSQLSGSLEGEPGPTPAGKTLPYSYTPNKYNYLPSPSTVTTINFLKKNTILIHYTTINNTECYLRAINTASYFIGRGASTIQIKI